MNCDSSDNKKLMLEALEASMGIVSSACAIVNISRQTHYRWLKEDSEYKSAVEALEDVVLDMAETALHKNVKAGDTTAIIFLLKTKGKRRGYIERSQIETKSVTEFSDMTDEELEDYIAKNE